MAVEHPFMRLRDRWMPGRSDAVVDIGADTAQAV